ncbi:MAG: cadherin-like domain-containing protein [Pseudomonadota bacterium]
MSDTNGVAFIAPDMVVQGKIINGRRVDVQGYVDGTISSDLVVVAPGGRAYGNVRAVKLEVAGEMQGDIRVKELIRIGDGGSVAGKVQYGSIALSSGGELLADVRNVPPSLAGDMTITVHRGRSTVVTRQDLQAVDPDDAPDDLTFEVSNTSGGMVALTSAPTKPVTTFTQAQINARSVMFVHDGSASETAHFHVLCRDASSATSGKPEKVTAIVKGGR